MLRYRVTSPGLPTVTGSSLIVIGRPALVVDAHPDRLGVAPGGSLAVALTIRNTGDVPAHGVALFMDTRDGLAPAGKHSNCRYRSTTSLWCRLAATDVVIPPGTSYRLGAREVLTAASDSTYPRVSLQAACSVKNPRQASWTTNWPLSAIACSSRGTRTGWSWSIPASAPPTCGTP